MMSPPRIIRRYNTDAQKRIFADFRALAGPRKKISNKTAFDEMRRYYPNITNETLSRLGRGEIKSPDIVQAFVSWIDSQTDGYQQVIDSGFGTLPTMWTHTKGRDQGHAALDMVRFDRILASKDEALSGRLRSLRKRILPDLQQIPISDYAHNSVVHAVQTTEFISYLFSDFFESDLSAYELFLLGALAYVHDVGMYPISKEYSPKQMYRIHARQSQLYAEGMGAEGYLEADEVVDLSILCKYHNRPMEEAYIGFQESETDARLPLIFAMFRIGDMLDVETQPGEMLRIEPKVLQQTISEVIPDPKTRSVVISKAPDAPSERFLAWQKFFGGKLETFNVELRKIGADYTTVFEDFSR